MEFVRPHEVLGLLGDPALGVGREQFGADGRVDDVEQRGARRGVLFRRGGPLHEVAHQRLGNRGVDADTERDAATRATLLDIIDTPVSPELLPADAEGKIAQKTEDLVGPYELHDFFLYNFLRAGYGPAKILLLAEQAFEGSYDRATILKWLTVFVRRFFTQQFKRSAMPDGPKVGSVSLSPRGDWRMPSDASAAAWLREVEEL